jgi:uncharacterized protein
MLVEFSVGNFRSFKDIQTLSMVAAPISSKNKELDEQNTFQATPKLRLLKTKAIYGANGSGKSNLVNAMMFFRGFVELSFKQNVDVLSLAKKFIFSTESINEPTYFQVIFVINKVIYRYGFEIEEGGISSEWLFATPDQREVYFFKRAGNTFELNNKHINGAKKIQNLVSNIKGTSLLLSLLASLNNDIAILVENYFSNYPILDSLETDVDHELIRTLSTNEFISKENRETVELLKYADNSINSMDCVDIADNDEKMITFSVNLYDEEKNKKEQMSVPFFEFASVGTKRVFDIAPFIHMSFDVGTPLIIDEFDSKLHPIITKKIVELYNKNKNNAQLIFVTHDTNLLDSKLLRRDQIAFIEKDKYGASHLYDLVEFKGVRNDASFEKDYLDGRYGAIPFVGNFEYVFSK